MKLSEAIEKLGLTVYSPPSGDPELSFGYASDLLSDVIANAAENCVWITMQTHANIIAVAALKDAAAILIVSGHKPAEETLKIATDKGVVVLGSVDTSFEVCGRLWEAGLRGREE